MKCTSEKETFTKKAIYIPETNSFEFPKKELYMEVPHYHPQTRHSLRVLDPVLANPNSYENLVAVLRRIGYISGIQKYGNPENKGTRKMVSIEMDGLPLSIVLNLIDNFFECPIDGCKLSVYGKDSL